jgi:hypothetical protein
LAVRTVAIPAVIADRNGVSIDELKTAEQFVPFRDLRAPAAYLDLNKALEDLEEPLSPA